MGDTESMQKPLGNNTMQPDQAKPTTEIYQGLDTSVDHPDIHGDPFFGIYRGSDHRIDHLTSDDDLFEYVRSTESVIGKAPVSYKGVVNEKGVEEFTSAILNQDVKAYRGKYIQAILNTPDAFDGVSKDDFARAFIKAIQSPKAAAFAAVGSMMAIHHSLKLAPLPGVSESGRLATIAYGFGSNSFDDASVTPSKPRVGFLASTQELRLGGFEKNPLTADEIKAIPYLSGFYADLYEAAGVDLSAHAASVTQKLNDAGYTNIAGDLAKRHNVELKAEAPARKYSHDDGPSL